MDELLKVYKEELLALDGKDRRSMVPVGEISFLIFNEDPGEISLTQNKDGSYNNEISYSTEGQAIITQTESTYSSRYTYGFDPGKSYNQVIYPLYAEFTHTMSLLEEMGYTGWEVDMSLVSHAEFYTYEYIYPTDRTDNIVAYEGIYDEKFLEDSRTIEDKDELARLIAETYSYDAFSGNGFLRRDDSCCLQIYDIYDNSYDRYYVLH